MSKSIVFPYGITLRDGRQIDLFPAAEVRFPGEQASWFSLFLIIDSGATISALPKSDARAFGIAVEDGIPASVSGIEGKPISGWRHELSVRLGTETLRLPILFLDQEGVPRILGREGIFDRFTIVFEEKRRRTGFLKETSKESKQVQRVLDKILTR